MSRPALIPLPAGRLRDLLPPLTFMDPWVLWDTELRVNASLSTVMRELKVHHSQAKFLEKLFLQTQLLDSIASHGLERKGWAVLP